MTTSWNKNTKPTTTYTKSNKFVPLHLRCEDGKKLVRENGFLLVIKKSLCNFYSKVTKTVSSWTKGAKP